MTARAEIGYKATPLQHSIIGQIIGFLRSDLYRLSNYTDASDVWVSPGRWSVEVGYNCDGETVWVVIMRPNGAIYAEAKSVDDVTWLSDTLP